MTKDFLLLETGDYLLLETGDKLVIRETAFTGTALLNNAVFVSFRDKRETTGFRDKRVFVKRRDKRTEGH